jgi:signal transduction histidine kinase
MIADHSRILVATIPELKNMKIIDDASLFSFIRKTSNNFFYQLVSPPLQDRTVQILIVSRIPRDKDARPKQNKGVFIGLVFILVFELICITMVVNLSNTISRSITVLEKNTTRIANGELNLKIEQLHNHESNEITSLTESLDKMRRSLKEEEERRTRFIMGISHDLRTPVAVIKGYTEALSDKVLDDPTEIHTALEIINTKTNQLETMIESLISFVKLNNREWRDKLVPQPIEPVLTEFVKGAIMTGEVFKRNVTSSIEISPSRTVPLDKMLFQRALENIFSNALRYTKDNDSIAITATETAKDIIVKISDTGCGIAEKDREHIFDLFYRGTNSRREEGMGIGLAVVKNIIDTHGWTISIDTKTNEGSSFIIKIPIETPIKTQKRLNI